MKEALKKIYQHNFRSFLVQGAEFVGKYDFPMLRPTAYTPTKAIPFDKIKSVSDKNQWVHFYLDDYRFECLWNRPKQYLNLLRSFEGVITPDYSVFTYLPEAMQIWNTYRNRALAYWLQSHGVPIIPNVRWGLENSYDYCFDGIPKGGTVAVSTNGCLRSAENREWFRRGLEEMVRRLKPTAIVNYGSLSKGLYDAVFAQGIPVYPIDYYLTTVRLGGER